MKLKFLSFNNIVKWILIAIFVAIVAGILNWIVGSVAVMSGGFAAVVSGLIVLLLLGFAIKMRPGTETFIDFIVTALVVSIVLGIFAGLGINWFSATFKLNSILGVATAMTVIFLGEVLAQKTMKAIGW